MSRRVLMIGFHYPPLAVSSGLQRMLKYSVYLGEHDWQPMVLSAHPRAYERTSDGQLGDIPGDMVLHRAFALDTRRHLSIGGRYPGLLALPDRWISWWLGAVPRALWMVRRYRPDVIWSTYPIATAHLIALTVHRLTGLPWVADCRDSMTEADYPRNPRTRRVFRWIERHMAARASRVVFTTPGTERMYAERYPDTPSQTWRCIPNGYDEADFDADVEAPPAPTPDAPVTLLHSGVIYPSERDPGPFFDALAALKDSARLTSRDLRVVLRASGNEAAYQRRLAELRIDDMVELAPPIAYADALAEMRSTDALLILQGASCNHQIPAKVYEYMRAGRPVLALTDDAGDTAAVLRECGIDSIAPLDDASAIQAMLTRFVPLVREQRAPVAASSAAERYSRRAQTGDLARLLDEVVTQGTGA